MVTNTQVTTEVVETGEKRDRLGRKITPADRRAELVAGWKSSGLTQAEFARREGVVYSSFAAWVQAARQTRNRPGKMLPVRFVEAKLPSVDRRTPACWRLGCRTERCSGARVPWSWPRW